MSCRFRYCTFCFVSLYTFLDSVSRNSMLQCNKTLLELKLHTHTACNQKPYPNSSSQSSRRHATAHIYPNPQFIQANTHTHTHTQNHKFTGNILVLHFLQATHEYPFPPQPPGFIWSCSTIICSTKGSVPITISNIHGALGCFKEGRLLVPKGITMHHGFVCVAS